MSARDRTPRVSRRSFLCVAAGTTCAAGLGLYSWRVEPHWLELVRRMMPVRHLPPA